MFFDLKIALSSLKAHRLRTILAMVGVFLGALALTGVQHVSEGMLLKAKVETAKLGTNLFIARSGQVHFRRSGSASVHNEAKTFTLADARTLMDSLPSARLGAPFVAQTTAIRAGDIKVPCQMVATWPTYPRVRNFVPEYGRFFTPEEEDRRAKVCVLGRKIAERLFGRPQAALGQEVFFSTASARVIGVMEEKGADITGTDQDEQVFVPLTTYMRRLSNQDWISGVYLQLADPGNYARAKKAAEHILRRRHRIGAGEKDDFSVLTAQDTMQVQQQALDLVQTLGIISSSVSFAVGGLGILSIMILLVRTRRLEIGIRRAVGARRRDIMRQFILEAGLMAGIGGGLGVLAAAGLVLIVYKVGKIPVFYDPLLILGPLAGSVFLGLVAGAYPAWQAAHVEVLEVLRNE
ncbi:MAG: ABC transporter permease [Desulfuromonadales bacterium]|jgi:putative ABC transport system permease protein